MNSETLAFLYNCSAWVLERNVTLLLRLNYTELLSVVHEALNSSDRSDFLRDRIVDCVFANQERPFNLPWWQKLLWSLIYTIIVLVAIGGNSIVMWIVLAHRRMRTITNYFLVNLSVADLMMSSLNCGFNFIFLVNSDWPFGAVYCTINNFVAHVTVASSVFTLVVISFDRYMAIMHPLKHRMSRKRTIITLIFIWGISSALAIPCLLYSTTTSRRYSNGTSRVSCYLLWPDGGYLHSKTEYTYNLLFLAVTYLIPMTVMIVCYGLMGRELCCSRSIGEVTHNQRESMKSKRKVVKMFGVVVTIFAVCWLPYQGFFIFVYHHRHFAESSYVQHVFLSFYWLAMSNSMVNPIIYYWMNNRFRVYFKLVICKCCRAIGRKNTQSHEMQELTGFQRSVACNSGRYRSTSIKWRHSTAESQVHTFKINPRTVCEKIQSKEGISII
ncbi:tachykinin-like peptides receptor 86C isoform X2 [Harpegnathos saltator]|uniref:tachykinin-like peptides receptor 86C isoform X2 n=1 Tax=Harpegnathos saltator TaxID=610380 RepID=UPI00058D65B0|nr:tachykinin-like peptides receptor 86C isoform X2 [Harpegnathos saltator]